ncbi:hypothetical protein EVAR_53234_1 [Eumeta japonica]|uniref:Uncharacterized protein n=1 Tax=Eumeta variegata TaxID=151549 RepID=A0A4C1XG91_EUMVA|nr:hypothetical protein EVAR_53234_1 [Eumeta japonica]
MTTAISIGSKQKMTDGVGRRRSPVQEADRFAQACTRRGPGTRSLCILGRFDSLLLPANRRHAPYGIPGSCPFADISRALRELTRINTNMYIRSVVKARFECFANVRFGTLPVRKIKLFIPPVQVQSSLRKPVQQQGCAIHSLCTRRVITRRALARGQWAACINQARAGPVRQFA